MFPPSGECIKGRPTLNLIREPVFRDDLARGVGWPRSFITVKVAAVVEVLVAFERQITVTSSSLRTHLNPTCRKQAEFERVSKLRGEGCDSISSRATLRPFETESQSRFCQLR